jgi:hypothetical protein
MDSMTLFKDLWPLLNRSVAAALKETLKSEATDGEAKAKALDLFSSSGYLLQASSAFAAALSEYLEYREVGGGWDDSIAQRELMSSTDYFADAVDTFLSVFYELQLVDERYYFPLYADADRGSKPLSDAIYHLSRRLEGCRIMLDDARQCQVSLRRTVTDLRRLIRQKFSFAEYTNG